MNKALLGAYRKGYKDAVRSPSAYANPYLDKRTSNGSATWSRGFRTAYHEGYTQAKADMSHGDYDGWYEDRAKRF